MSKKGSRAAGRRARRQFSEEFRTRQLRARAPDGRVLVVWKLDRLGCNLAHLANTVQDLSARSVGLRVLTGQGAQIDTTTTAAGHLVFGIFAALAEFEGELIRERTLAGLTAARTPGRQDVRAVESPGAAGPGGASAINCCYPALISF